MNSLIMVITISKDDTKTLTPSLVCMCRTCYNLTPYHNGTHCTSTIHTAPQWYRPHHNGTHGTTPVHNGTTPVHNGTTPVHTVPQGYHTVPQRYTLLHNGTDPITMVHTVPRRYTMVPHCTTTVHTAPQRHIPYHADTHRTKATHLTCILIRSELKS